MSATLGINDKSFTNGINNSRKSFSSFSSFVQSSISTITKVGTGTLKTIGIIGGALGGLGLAGIKVGSDFEVGMSQVAATMGVPKSEIQNLTDEAKRLGSTTQFTATQASDAFNYLALAGYDAEKSIEAIPNVLNLAAAGSLDLGYASDLVTDSMAALGLQTDELEVFVDQLSRTSQRSNTDISQLGEAILTVGGTAKYLKGGTVELNTALGLLADEGEKGSEAGTKLRNVIMSLTAPTDTAAKELKKLGVNAFDSSGDLRPLEEIMGDLNDALSDATSKERANALNKIFNKQDLKAVETLLGTTTDRWTELTDEITNSAGATSDIAAEMMDNLTGDITTLKSGLEGLGIEFYDSVNSPLRDITQTTTEMVGRLKDAFSKNGLSGMLEELGSVISDVVVNIAKSGPEITNTAIKMVDSFVSGIASNLSDIVQSGSLIIESLISGLQKTVSSILPIVSGIVPLIAQVFISGTGLILETGIKIITAIATGIADNIDVLISTALETISSLISTITENLPVFLQAGIDIVMGLGEGLIQALPMIIDAAVEIILSLAKGITSNLGDLVVLALDIIVALADGLIQAVPELLKEAPVIIGEFIGAFIATLPQIIAAGVELVISLIHGIIDSIPQLVAAIPNLIIGIVGGIVENLDKIILAGPQIILALATGIIEAIPKLLAQLPTIFISMKDSLLSFDWIQIGKDIISGLINGIKNMAGAAVDVVKGVGENILSSVKGFFGIHSPSTVFADIGGNLMEGMSQGIDNKSGDVSGSIDDVTEDVKGGLHDVSPESNNLDEWISGLSATASAEVPKFIDQVSSLFSELPDKIAAVLNKSNSVVIDWVNSLSKQSVNGITNMVDSIVNPFTKLPTQLAKPLNAVTITITNWNKTMSKTAMSGSKEFVTAISKNISTVPIKFQSDLSPAVRTVTSWWTSMNSAGTNGAKTFLNSIVNTTKTIPSQISTTINPAINEVNKWAGNLESAGKKAGTALKNSVINNTSGLPSQMQSLGVQMVNGLIKGVNSKQSALNTTMKNIAKGAVTAAKKELDIRSPSRVFEQVVAWNMMDGWINGVSERGKELIDEIKDVSKEAQKAAMTDITPEFRELTQGEGSYRTPQYNAVSAQNQGTARGGNITINQTIQAPAGNAYEEQKAALNQARQAAWRLGYV